VSLIASPLRYSPEVAALVLDVMAAGASRDYPEVGPIDGLYVPRGVGCWQHWAAYRASLATIGVDWAYAELVRGLVLALDHEPAAGS
jgi:hypothetical protein